MSNRKTMIRVFTISDYKCEEAFLREQHNKGYKLVRVILPCFYIFEKCEPEDVIYQLNLADGDCNRDAYLQIFKDSGWEFLFKSAGWDYFRKSASVSDGDLSIFTDEESKISLAERVFKVRMTPLIIIFLCCIIPQLFMNFDRWTSEGSSGFSFLVAFMVLFAIYVMIFIHCGLGLHRLKHSSDSNPVKPLTSRALWFTLTVCFGIVSIMTRLKYTINSGTSISHIGIGGADGPTSIFIAGKISSEPIWLYVLTGVFLIITIVTTVRKVIKKK